MAGKIKNLKNNPVCVRAGVIGAVSAVCFAVVFLMDNSREINRNGEGQSILERNDPGEGKSTGELEARIGDVKENVSVSISEQAYSPEELAEVFEQAGEDLESLILGENRSIEEVRSDLDLITEIPDSGISVSWQLDNYDVMDIQGNIFEEELTEDGILVKLTAVLSYGSEKASHEFYARVYKIGYSAWRSKPEKSRFVFYKYSLPNGETYDMAGVPFTKDEKIVYAKDDQKTPKKLTNIANYKTSNKNYLIKCAHQMAPLTEFNIKNNKTIYILLTGDMVIPQSEEFMNLRTEPSLLEEKI